MKRNVGTIDRTVRVVVGIALLSLVFVGPQTLWGLIGIIPLASGLMGYCLGYNMCSFSTCKRA